MNNYLIFIFIFISCLANSQSLLDELNADSGSSDETIYTDATFKAPRLINGQSVETAGKKGLNFIISHRFGNLNSGKDEFFGLDESHIRLGIEYGLTDRFDIGIGRSREQKLADGYFKLKVLRQSSGAKVVPVSISYYASTAIRTDDGIVAGRNYSFSNRLNYVHELLIARKFSDRISIQIIPGLVHRNLTPTKKSPNIVPYTGIGGRFKITARVSVSSEYYYNWSEYIADNFVNPLSIGLDIETGGHIFQLHFSNSRAMHEKIMIPENQNNWLDGDFGFGFNIIRNFNLKQD